MIGWLVALLIVAALCVPPLVQLCFRCLDERHAREVERRRAAFHNVKFDDEQPREPRWPN